VILAPPSNLRSTWRHSPITHLDPAITSTRESDGDLLPGFGARHVTDLESLQFSQRIAPILFARRLLS